MLNTISNGQLLIIVWPCMYFKFNTINIVCTFLAENCSPATVGSGHWFTHQWGKRSCVANDGHENTHFPQMLYCKVLILQVHSNVQIWHTYCKAAEYHKSTNQTLKRKVHQMFNLNISGCHRCMYTFCGYCAEQHRNLHHASYDKYYQNE